MPPWKNISRVFYLLMLKTLSLVLVILPLWAYELLGTCCFFSISCTISVSSVSGYPNCPVLGPLLIMLNSEALKLMVSVCHTNKHVYYLCNSFNALSLGENQSLHCLQQYNSGKGNRLLFSQDNYKFVLSYSI